VYELRTVEVFFDENVTNVNAADLLLNNVAATNVAEISPSQYLFTFNQPANGNVQVTWAAGHGIVDESGNAFVANTWSYVLDPAFALNSVRINEFMTDNETGIRDEDGTYQDWIELYNPSSLTVSLDGCFLTDTKLKLDNWRFPAVVMAPNTYLLVWASNKNRTNNVANLHTNFRLDPDGEYLAFIGPQTNVISAYDPEYPAQRTDVSYGRDQLDPRISGFYSQPSPRAANPASGSSSDFSADVYPSRESGTFLAPFSLSLSTLSSNAVIRYIAFTNLPATAIIPTNVPGPSSPIYTGAIPVNATMQVRARAFEPGKLPSTPVTWTFIQISPTLVNFSSDLPQMVFTTFGQTLAASGDGTAYVMLFDNALDRSSLTNRPDLASRAALNDRGSSTGGQPKNNMALEYWDEFNQDTDKPFLNMPPESDWVLYGINGFDPSLMHNAIFHWFGRSVDYSSRTRYVEVWRKTDFLPLTTNDYWGLYLAEEKPKRNANRVNIENLQPENTNSVDITGGYLLKIDRQDGDEVAFTVASISVPSASYGGQTTLGGQAPIFISPNLTPSSLNDSRRVMQRNYIQNYLNQFVQALTNVNAYTNPVTGYRAFVDVDSWVDSLIVNTITFNVDGYRLSGYFFKDRGKKLEQGPPWDCDRCLGTGGSVNTPQGDSRPWNPRVWRTYAADLGNDQGTDFFGRSNVGVNWFNATFRDPDFWQRFIDRYQAFRLGKFSDQAVVDMVEGFYQEIKEAQLREQTRWAIRTRFTWPRAGNSSVTTTTTGGGVTYNSTYAFDFGPTNSLAPAGGVFGYFTNEVRHQKKWLTDRLNFMDTNFLAMPTVTLAEGPVTNGTTVTVTPAAKAGTVLYYTLDGTDPRLPGGAISPAALNSSGPVTLTVNNNIRLFVRCYNPNHANLTNQIPVGNPPLNSFWSGPQERSYYSSIPPLRITEIMYHPADPPTGNTNDADNFEYVEVKNVSATPLNVNRFRLRGGIEFDFPNVVLTPGQQAVVVSHLAAFQARYGGTPLVLGTYANRLANDGDHIVLEGNLHEPIHDFNYSDEWYPITDGGGFSLQIINENDPNLANWGLKTSWRPSGVIQGTPGSPDPGPPATPTVYINEALTHTDPTPGDAIELYNPSGTTAADVGGWYLTDNFDSPKKYRIPNGTSIPANGYLVFYESNSFGVGPDGFALSSKGEAVYVFSADAVGNLTGYFHGFDFGAEANGVTFGRYVVSTGEDQFPAQSTPTLGAANSGPRVGPLVISEINYHPVDYSYPKARVDDNVDEYIELHNISSSPVALYDTLHPENTWQLRDAVNFTFPRGVVIPPNGYVLVVSFTPTNGPTLDSFRAFNGVPPNLPIYGPWSGQLDNSEDSIELTRPDLPDPLAQGFVAYVLTDKVRYHDQAPWPTNADGLGFSLQRRNESAYGNDPANWAAAGKTPGSALTVGGTAPTITVQPPDTVGTETYPVTITVTADGSEPLSYQWFFAGLPIRGASSRVLTLNNLRLDQAGLYSCLIANTAGEVRSRDATLTIRQVVRIQQHPTDVRLRGSTNSLDYGFTTNNAVFSVAATGTGTLHYQWRFNGVNIPGAVGSTLTLNNVGLTNDGNYDVVITDNIAPITSLSARLLVLISPSFVQSPFNQVVATNGTMSVCVIIRGNPPPFRYEWREISTVRGSFISVEATNFFSYGPITNTAPRQWRLVVFNEANQQPGSLASFNVNCVPDLDNDGIPDTWETDFGFNPANGNDAGVDTDGDGLSNYEEYLVGTDPTNQLSNLRVDLVTTPGTASVQVSAMAGRTYTVQYTDNIDADKWSRLIDVVARSTNHVETIPDPNYTANRFYRVVYPQQSQ
jgi:hypothetical protein